MAAKVSQHHKKFEVNFATKTIVKASHPPQESHTLTLSNLDLLSGRFPVTYFYFYHKPLLNHDFHSIIEALKISLAETLNFFYPFAGRIVENASTGEPEIICDNNGALILEAHANIPLKDFNFHNLDDSLKGKLISIHESFPFQAQVTSYACGSVSITFTFDHALGDASSFGKFLLAWSEMSLKKPISSIPNHRRSLLNARVPPRYDKSLDQDFVACTLEEIQNMPLPKTLVKRLYYVHASRINELQSLASANGEKRTKIEAFSAYIWKVMVSVVEESNEKCKMGWLVDGRGRLMGNDSSLSNYIGNVLSVAFGEASLTELKQWSISDIAKVAHEAIGKVANEAHFLDLIDWIECHRPGLMLSRVVLGRGGPAVVLSSCRRFPVVELDFGFGRPVLGTVCSTVEKIGVNYFNQRPAADEDGSWVVSAILWPELAEALESKSIFQPMSASHLHV
ncbi:coniferyl alcohol acyltransferase [Malania oleifera]|uniref:coniferyl alcohol acyltransferase n=1 Tax=Malania oleifera TaxID=397392 RepID=UPI0025AE0F5B|nr:coniferyl alcohol acyltransferase [Malania oleifera]